MKRLLLFVLAIPLCSGMLSAQNVHFSYFDHIAVQDPANNNIEAVEIDANGNDYSLGIFTQTATFGLNGLTEEYNSPEGASFFIQKRNPDGSVEFNAVYQSSIGVGARFMHVDDNENVYITGTFSGVIDFDLGEGVYEQTTSGELKTFVLKIDANGDFVWLRTIDVVGGEDNATPIGMFANTANDIFVEISYHGTIDINTDPDEQVLLSSGDDLGACFLKLNENGDYQSEITIENSSTLDVYRTVTDENDNFIRCYVNVFTETVEEDGEMIDEHTVRYLLEKYDESFDLQWTKIVDFPDEYDFSIGPESSGIEGLKTDEDGNIFVLGHYTGEIHFDGENPAGFVSTLPETKELFVTKYNPSGDFLWVSSVAYEEGSHANPCDLDVDKDGNSYVAAFNRYWAPEFDPGFSKVNGHLLKFSHNGELLWDETWIGENAVFGHRVAVGADNSVLFSGKYHAEVDFAPGTLVENHTSPLGQSPFVLKLLPFAVELEENSLNAAVYSSPYSNKFSIVLEDTHKKISIELYNSLGQIVKHLEYFDAHTLEIDLPNPMGLYIADIKTGNGSEARLKLMKN